jgi:hypothetical protein
MALDYRHEPLPTKWPGKPRPAHYRARSRSPFKSTWWRTEELLERELRHLKAKEIVIHLDVANPARDLRFDGKLRADARPTSGRVVLSFRDDQGQRQYFPCDTFRDWQVNLHAIAITLERMRQVELYEVVWGGQQYVGFKRLPGAGGASEPAPLGPRDAAERIAQHSDFRAQLIFEEGAVAKIAIQQAQRRSHPDHGGTAAQFQAVQEAAEVLDKHHVENVVSRSQP